MAEPTDTSTHNGFDIDLLLKHVRGYLEFGEQLQPLSARFQKTLMQQGDWRPAVTEYFNTIKTALVQAAEDSESHSQLALLWIGTLDIWQQTIATLDWPSSPDQLADFDSEAWRKHQRTQMEYLDLLRQSVREAVVLMEQRISEQTATGLDPQSLRELYNLWVECNEETYGYLLRSEAYSECSGRLLNTLLHCYPQRGNQ